MSDTSINMTAAMDANDIQTVRRWRALDRVTVTLYSGQVGSGRTVGEAIAAAKQDLTFAKYARAA